MNTSSIVKCALFSSAVLLAGACADPPVCECDAAITKVALTPLSAGGTGKFGILVDYSGHPLCTSGKICIHDVLAPGLTFAGASPSAWTCAATGQDVHCCFNGPLPVTHTALPMLELTVNVSPKVADTIKNCASIEQDAKGDFADSDDANNQSCITEKVSRVDLAIKKHHVGTFSPGAVGVFQLDVSNNSSSPATGVTVSDVLNTTFTFVPSPTAAPWSCAALGQTVTCTLAGTLPPFTSAPPILLDVQLSKSPGQDKIKNCASVSSNGADANPGDNRSCDSVEVSTCSQSQSDLTSGVVNASAMPGAVGSLDDSWTIVKAPDPNLIGPTTILSPNPAWQAALPGSQWIGPPNGDSTGVTGFYTYESCFCLKDGLSAPSLALSMLADDQIKGIQLNGCELPGPPGGLSNSGAPLVVKTSDAACFHPGKNCIDVLVENGPGPTSFDVTGTVTSDSGLCCP
ncbi:MAG: hypothetical protein ABJE95_22025 [Byssovorax sp.]